MTDEQLTAALTERLTEALRAVDPALAPYASAVRLLEDLALIDAALEQERAAFDAAAARLVAEAWSRVLRLFWPPDGDVPASAGDALDAAMIAKDERVGAWLEAAPTR